MKCNIPNLEAHLDKNFNSIQGKRKGDKWPRHHVHVGRMEE